MQQDKKFYFMAGLPRSGGTLSSFAVAYAITRSASLSGAIAFWEIVVKVFIYYAHERGWNKINWGRV
jgi:uncharacterized membrane protein